jgi:hypothetical protein
MWNNKSANKTTLVSESEEATGKLTMTKLKRYLAKSESTRKIYEKFIMVMFLLGLVVTFDVTGNSLQKQQ